MVLGEKINKINIRDIFSTKTKYVFFSYKKIRKEMEMEYDSKNPDDFKFEGHTKYIDIQYIWSGIEEIEVVNIKKATGGEGYIEEREVEFYKGGENTARFILEKGEYGIFYPDDIHKPGLMHQGKSTPVKKILLKVLL